MDETGLPKSLGTKRAGPNRESHCWRTTLLALSAPERLAEESGHPSRRRPLGQRPVDESPFVETAPVDLM